MRTKMVKGKKVEMAELKDYSGEFVPDLKYEDLSKEALVKLVNTFGGAFIAITGFWWSVIENKFGPEVASAAHNEIWEKWFPQWIVPHLSKALNITGDNVETLFKIWQLVPDGTMGYLDINWDVKDPNHGIMTITRCPGLSFYERKQPERIDSVCHDAEIKCNNAYAKLVNPNMKATPLKLPPRSSKDEICCQWEIKVESKKRKTKGEG
jgi:hypothetical protein